MITSYNYTSTWWKKKNFICLVYRKYTCSKTFLLATKFRHWNETAVVYLLADKDKETDQWKKENAYRLWYVGTKKTYPYGKNHRLRLRIHDV